MHDRHQTHRTAELVRFTLLQQLRHVAMDAVWSGRLDATIGAV